MASGMWDWFVLPKWIPTQIDRAHVILTLWYKKNKLLVEFEGNVGPESFTCKLKSRSFVGTQLAKGMLASMILP